MESVTVPDVGHAPTLDEPEAQAAIDALLKRVDGEEELAFAVEGQGRRGMSSTAVKKAAGSSIWSWWA